MRQLVIDAGNTLIKGAVFENSQIVERFQTKGKSLADFLIAVSALDQLPDQVLISSVRADSDSLYESLTDLGINHVLSFRSGLKLPIKIQYKTPETLGTDRIANACMAAAIFPKNNILAIDIGTCIKFDMVT
ncbi:MAG: type III pantothenate kinase, partial [Bacteroidota bacterium]